jgi:uncharacterized membrane protein
MAELVAASLVAAEWEEVLGAIASKIVAVRGGVYGEFDPVDGFDPEEWAKDLETIFRKLEEQLGYS